MKTLIITSLLTLISMTVANAAVTAKMHFSYNDGAEISDGMSTIRLFDAELNDEQTIEVKMTTYRGRFGSYQAVASTPIRATKILGDLTFNKLNLLSQRLNQSEIETTTRAAVCMVMPGFGTNHSGLVLTQEDGSEKRIYGPQGCWIPVSIYPKDQYSKKLTAEISTMLKTLALDAVEL